MAAAAAAAVSVATVMPKAVIGASASSSNLHFRVPSPKSSSFPRALSFRSSSKTLPLCHRRPISAVGAPLDASVDSPAASSPTTFTGPCYVVGDNIDTDQIIPAEYLTLVPSKPEEYQKLGSFALVGLPSAAYPIPFVEPGATSTGFPIVIGGANFGCGSSREHAPVALGAAGVKAVVAEYYARIFFRNSVATGEIYPVEYEKAELWKECTTGDIVTVDLAASLLVNHATGKEYKLKPIGDAGPVIEAGGIFAYARNTGMIAAA